MKIVDSGSYYSDTDAAAAAGIAAGAAAAAASAAITAPAVFKTEAATAAPGTASPGRASQRSTWRRRGLLMGSTRFDSVDFRRCFEEVLLFPRCAAMLSGSRKTHRKKMKET